MQRAPGAPGAAGEAYPALSYLANQLTSTFWAPTIYQALSVLSEADVVLPTKGLRGEHIIGRTCSNTFLKEALKTLYIRHLWQTPGMPRVEVRVRVWN